MRFAGVLAARLFLFSHLGTEREQHDFRECQRCQRSGHTGGAGEDHEYGHRRTVRYRHQFRRTVPRRSAGAGKLPRGGRRRGFRPPDTRTLHLAGQPDSRPRSDSTGRPAERDGGRGGIGAGHGVADFQYRAGGEPADAGRIAAAQPRGVVAGGAGAGRGDDRSAARAPPRTIRSSAWPAAARAIRTSHWMAATYRTRWA